MKTAEKVLSELGITPQRYTRHSGELLCLCPFHDDHKPSMSVNEDTGLWQCWGCHSSGDLVGLVSQKLKISRKKAEEWMEEGPVVGEIDVLKRRLATIEGRGNKQVRRFRTELYDKATRLAITIGRAYLDIEVVRRRSKDYSTLAAWDYFFDEVYKSLVRSNGPVEAYCELRKEFQKVYDYLLSRSEIDDEDWEQMKWFEEMREESQKDDACESGTDSPDEDVSKATKRGEGCEGSSEEDVPVQSEEKKSYPDVVF